MIAVALIAGLLFAGAGGSDAPTPYTVDGSGVTLPAGQVFVDGGHVNIKSSNPAARTGIHFEALNNQPSGVWIGESHLPWTAFGLVPCDVVPWVQVAEFNEHYGEGGQPPVVVAPCGTSDPDPDPETRTIAGESFACDFWTHWTRTEQLKQGEWVIVSELSSLVPTNEGERVARGCVEIPVSETPEPIKHSEAPESEKLAVTGLNGAEVAVIVWAVIMLVAGLGAVLGSRWMRGGGDG